MSTGASTSESDEKRPRRRRWRWVCWLLAILFLPTLCVIAYKEYRYRREIALMRAEGLPTSFAELEAWRGKLKPEEDATDLWLAVVEEWNKARASPPKGMPPDGKSFTDSLIDSSYAVPTPGEAWPDYPSAKVKARPFERMFQLMRKARLKGDSRLPTYLDGIQWWNMSTTKQFTHVRPLFRLHAAILAHEEKIEELVEFTMDILSMADAAANAGTFSDSQCSHLLRIYVMETCLPWIIENEHTTMDQLKAIRRSLEGIDIPGETQKSFVTESVHLIENASAWPLNSGISIPHVFFRDEILLGYRKRHSLCQLSTPDAIEVWDAYKRKSLGMTSFLEKYEGTEMLGGVTWPAHQIREIRTGITAIAVREYWSEHRTIPKELAEIAGLGNFGKDPEYPSAWFRYFTDGLRSFSLESWQPRRPTENYFKLPNNQEARQSK